MTGTTEPRYRNWRQAWQKTFEAGERIELIATKYSAIPFVCYPDFRPPQLSWSAWGITLHEFSRRVKIVAAKFGVPDEVEGKHHSEASSDTETPPLTATWNRDGYDVVVTTYAPQGCKLDSRAQYHAAVNPVIHPECAAVLKELEDAGEANL